MVKYKKEMEPVVEETQVEAPQRPKIPFGHWFDTKVKAGRLKFYQDEALLVFVAKRGYTELEDEDIYEALLKLF